MRIELIITLLVLVVMMSCGSSTKTVKNSCITQNMSQLTLRWGGHNIKTNTLSGYQIDANSILYKFIKSSSDEDYKFEKISVVDEEKFCSFLKLTQKYFIEIQALNAPGDSSNFVEFSNPGTNTKLRAVWNVRYQTYGSQEFRGLFDSLNTFVEMTPEVMKRKGQEPGNSVK